MSVQNSFYSLQAKANNLGEQEPQNIAENIQILANRLLNLELVAQFRQLLLGEMDSVRRLLKSMCY